MEFFWRYTYFRLTQNDQNNLETKLLSKYSDCRDLSLEFFCGYSCFTPYKMAKTLIKILKQKILTKMLRKLTFISRTFLRLHMFSHHTKWPKHFWNKNLCPNCSECWDLSLESFSSYTCFLPIQNGQNTCKSFEKKLLSKMLRTSRFVTGIFLRLPMFPPQTKWPKHL